MMESAKAFDEAQEVKNWARDNGFTYAMSLYGVLTDRETGHSEYRRIEVLANTPYTNLMIQGVYWFFDAIKPLLTYSIWVYDANENAMLLLDQWR